MGMFVSSRKRAKRHVARINAILAETGVCVDAEVGLPEAEVIVSGTYGDTTIRLVFGKRKIFVSTRYDKTLSYYGKGIAFQEFVRLNRESKKVKWLYSIDPDMQKMICEGTYRMKCKPDGDKRFSDFMDFVFSQIPQTFDAIEAKAQTRGCIPRVYDRSGTEI